MKAGIFFLLVFFSGFLSPVTAQKPNRIAYIDMEYILANVPEYQQASAQLEERVQQWKKELEQDLKKVEDMKLSLEQERPLLTPELIEEREAVGKGRVVPAARQPGAVMHQAQRAQRFDPANAHAQAGLDAVARDRASAALVKEAEEAFRSGNQQDDRFVLEFVDHGHSGFGGHGFGRTN